MKEKEHSLKHNELKDFEISDDENWIIERESAC